MKKLKLIKKKNNLIKGSLKKGQRVGIEDLAMYLRFNLPVSERWFQKEWEKLNMLDHNDLFNIKCGPYIPDCINKRYKYIIEINGSIHNKPQMIESDLRKKNYFERLGFSFFTLKSYDKKNLELIAKQIREMK